MIVKIVNQKTRIKVNQKIRTKTYLNSKLLLLTLD